MQLQQRWNSRLARMSVTVAMTERSRATKKILAQRRRGFRRGVCFNHTPHEGGSSSGTIRAPVRRSYKPCSLSHAQEMLLDGTVSQPTATDGPLPTQQSKDDE